MKRLKNDFLFFWVVIVCLISGGAYFGFLDKNYAMNMDDAELSIKWLVEPTLKRAMDFHSGFAWIQKEYGDPWSLINKNGNEIVSGFQTEFIEFSWQNRTKNADLSEFARSRDGKFYYGYVNYSGDVVIPPIYQEANFPSDNLAAVQQGNFWGVVDGSGTVVIPFVYEKLTYFRHGVIGAKKEGKWGYIDARGQTVVDFIFNEIYPDDYPEGLYLVSANGKEGLLNKERNWVLEPIYEKVYPSTENLIGVQKDGKVGFVDHEGNVVIDFQYKGLSWSAPEEEKIPSLSHIYSFSEGLAVVWLSGPNTGSDKTSFGVINEKGELLFKLPGWPRGHYREGFLLVNRYYDKKMGLVDINGKWHSLPSIVKNVPYGKVSEGILRVWTTKDKWGFLKIEVKE
jgi:hypothetical protein